jgi:hypothetical protein
MSCYFCNDINAKEIKCETCNKYPLTKCAKCGKCCHCNNNEATDKLRAQSFAILQLGQRKYVIIERREYFSMSNLFFENGGQDAFLGPHQEFQIVSEKLSWREAQLKLYRLLHGLDS